MIRLLNLGPAKHEKVAIYAVNQRISNVCRIAGAALQRSNSQASQGHEMRSNPCIIEVKRSKSRSCLHDKAFELGTRQI